jgi:hypothetical protein
LSNPDNDNNDKAVSTHHLAQEEEIENNGITLTFRAFTRGKYNMRTELHEFVDTYELVARFEHLDLEKQSYYAENYLRESPVVESGDDGHLILLEKTSRYSANGSKFVCIPQLLKARRFYHVSHDDLDSWQDETKALEESQDILWVGHIAKDKPVIAHILELAGQDRQVIHPTYSTRDQYLSSLAEQNPDGAITVYEKDQNAFYNYDDIHVLVRPCGQFDCPVCYGPLMIFEEPQIGILGLPYDHPEAVLLRNKRKEEKEKKARMRQARLKELKEYVRIVTTLQQLIMLMPE